MAVPKPEEAVARAALALRAHAPTEWTAFLQALNQLREQHDDQLTEAPSESLHRAQGRAQSTRELLRTLMNAPALVQKYDQGKAR
jgi:hypothetical protein